jgi:hypothetical protein
MKHKRNPTYARSLCDLIVITLSAPLRVFNGIHSKLPFSLPYVQDT